VIVASTETLIALTTGDAHCTDIFTQIADPSRALRSPAYAPGGTSGVSLFDEFAIGRGMLELLKQIAPSVKSVGRHLLSGSLLSKMDRVRHRGGGTIVRRAVLSRLPCVTRASSVP